MISLMRKLALVFALLSGLAGAQYPGKPVRIIVPFTPASATDILGRVVAEQFAAFLKAEIAKWAKLARESGARAD